MGWDSTGMLCGSKLVIFLEIFTVFNFTQLEIIVLFAITFIRDVCGCWCCFYCIILSYFK